MSQEQHKIDRILHRKRTLQKTFQKENLYPEKYKYYLMEIDSTKIELRLKEFENKGSPINNLTTVRSYNSKEDKKIFSDLFNLVLLSSPDPWTPITEDDAETYFKDGTYLAFLYGKCVGYGVLTIENTNQGKIGVIAGMGVHPKFRRKKVALKLALAMGQWFLNKDDIKTLQCEVYEKNTVSYKFISSFGFVKIDEFYLD